MTNIFAITAATNSVTLDNKREGEVAFTVSNSSGRPLRARAQVVAEGDASSDWFTLQGNVERELAIAGTEQVTVKVKVANEVTSGTYVFRLNMVGVVNPDEEFGEGPTVTLDIPEPVIEKKKFPWWILIVILMVLLIGGAAAFFLLRGGEPQVTLAEVTTNSETAVAGSELSYTITISNTGRSPAETVVFTNTLPVGTSFSRISGADCVSGEADGEIGCTLSEAISRGEASEIDLVLTVAPTTRGFITNTVRLGEVTLPLSSTVTAQTNLAVSLGEPQPVESAFIYDILVSNEGPSQATGVVVSYEKTGIVFNADGQGAETACEDTGESLLCDLGDIAPQASRPLTLTVQPQSSGILTATVTVQSNEGESIDSEEVAVQVAPASELAIDVETTPSRAVVGEEISYAISILNATARPASNVQVTYNVPAGANFVDAQFESGDNCLQSLDRARIECDLGSIPAIAGDEPGTKTVTLILQVETDGTLENNITVRSNEFGSIDKMEATLVDKAFGSTGIRMDGLNDWAELSAFAIPESFTIEMWLNPDTDRDQQSFIGKHSAEGNNIFLIGYFNNGLYVNIRDETFSAGGRAAGLSHLAVTVEKLTATQSNVRTYKNGELFWEHEFTSVLGDINPANSRAWVLGQDWDGDNPTDFFDGTMTEVRLWDHVRSQAEIVALKEQRLNGDEGGLIGYWPLTENAGAIIPDFSTGGHNGTLQAGAQWVEPPSDFGTALAFDGLDDFVTIPDAEVIDFAVNQDFTVEFRVLPTAIQPYTRNSDNDMVEKWGVERDGSIGGYPYVIRYINQRGGANNGKISVGRYDRKNNPGILSVKAINDGKFHHIAFVKDGATLYLYVDGVLQGSTADTTTGTTTNNVALFLGRRGESNNINYFAGVIDELRIWNVPRTETQIQDAMSQPVKGNAVGLVGYWRFDEGSGGQIHDLSGRSLDGTLFGPTWTDSQ